MSYHRGFAMKYTTTRISVILLLALTAGIVVGDLIAGDPPAPPKLSSVVAPDDLVAQVKTYVASLGEATADEKTYGEKSREVSRDANTLVVLALFLAKHDADHELKSAAPAIFPAAQKLAKSKDYATAKAAYEQVRAAAAGSSSDKPELKWEKVASLGQLMKQATFINTRLRRNIRRFDEKAEGNARDAALLAVIAQAATFDTHEVKNPADLDKWYEFCAEMRDAASEVNAKIKAKQEDAANKAVARVAKSCETCHAVFHKGEK
jgi:hypothetical protein